MKVALKNGSQQEQEFVDATMVSLRSVSRSDAMAFFQLVMKCRGSFQRMFESSHHELRQLGLIEFDGSVLESVRSVVLSATVGNGPGGIILRSPIMGEEA